MSSIHRNSSEYSGSYSQSSYAKQNKNLKGKEQIKARGKLYKRLFSYPMAIGAMIPSLLFGAAPICIFVLFGKIINEMQTFVREGTITLTHIRNWCLYIVLIAVIAAICKFLVSFLWTRMGSRFILDLKADLFDSLMVNDIPYFDVTPIGDVLTLLGEDSQLVQDNFGTIKGIQFQNMGQCIAGIVLCYVYQWKLALITTCVLPFAFIVIFLFSRYIDNHINRKFFYVARMMTIAEETLSCIRTVKGFNREDIEYERFMKEVNMAVKEEIKALTGVNIMFSIIMIGVWALIIGNMYYGGKMVDNGELETGNLFSVFGFMMFGSLGLIELQTSLQSEQKAISSGARILAMISHVPTIPFSGGETIDNFKGHIEFRNVSFKYPSRDVYVLKNISFEIKPGKTAALVGHSGSGKSTCVQLLERFYDVCEGAILLDGHDIKSLDPRWLHRQIGLVGQEPILFQLTIKENIMYAKPDATMEEIEKAAEMANAKVFIEKLNGKYDFFVGEKGGSLSGGQRQRIAIARALITDPVILMTDEATSALDSASEKKVQIALDKIMATRTSVIVAHRLTTVKNADRIYAFDTGEIVERGTHRELIAKHGFYYELVKRQLKDADDDAKKEDKPKEQDYSQDNDDDDNNSNNDSNDDDEGNTEPRRSSNSRRQGNSQDNDDDKSNTARKRSSNSKKKNYYSQDNNDDDDDENDLDYDSREERRSSARNDQEDTDDDDTNSETV
ncbi:hypothetical protein M9Y10_039889 [Tritrichomonas musculus]|uniref:ABC transporter family protein n=1 Tax=Tritrichomonas musculus TaxID=1915356 RepID=A0ABR2GQR8_9EUKA